MLTISYNGLSCLRGLTPDRMVSAGIAFPLANVFSCFMTGNPSAITVALVNMVVALALAGEQIGMLTITVRREFAFVKKLDPLRVTSICTIVIAAIFLLGSNGASLLIIQGISFLAFSAGNYIQSDASLRNLKPSFAFQKALLHPALWFGVGYTFTGLTIAGGQSIFENMTATLFTIAGILEIIASLGMSVGKVVNKAGPFIGVTIGTVFLFAAGIATHNWMGAACAASAGLGELSLAIQTQQEQQTEALKTGIPVSMGLLTRPLQAFMDKIGIPKTTR